MDPEGGTLQPIQATGLPEGTWRVPGNSSRGLSWKLDHLVRSASSSDVEGKSTPFLRSFVLWKMSFLKCQTQERRLTGVLGLRGGGSWDLVWGRYDGTKGLRAVCL